MTDNFSSLFEFLPIGAYRSRPDGTQMRANPALVRLNGYDSEAEQLVAIRDIAREWYVEPGRRDTFMAQMDTDGRVVGFESEAYRHKTRERIWVSENAHAVRDEQGRVIFYEGTIEEVTPRVLAEQALLRTESQLKQLVSLLPGAVFRIAIAPDGHRRYTFISEGVRELYGIDPEEALRDNDALIRRRHPDDRARVAELSDAAIAAGQALTYEVRVRLDDGRERWVQVLSTHAPPEDGQQVRVGLVLDITARKQAEQALIDNGELWKRALESSGDGVWDLHLPSSSVTVSKQGKALYGYTDEELLDGPFALDRLTHPDDVARMRVDREHHFAGRTPAYVNEHRIRCKDGQWKWVLSRGIVLSRDAQGRPLRMIGTHTDITARKQTEALRFERDRAAAADLAKSQFLSRVSHELRTPLNAILGFGQLLELEPSLAERQLGWARQVVAGGRHLLALMDDLLDLSAVQTGQLPTHIEAVALPAALEQACAMLDSAAQAAGVSLTIELPTSAPLTVLADPQRLRQVITNLLSNAIKYNRPGGWVRVSALQHDGTVELSVADNGLGLSDDQVARLFNPFERVGAQRGTVAGTGLGLALTRELVQAMGGSVGVNSRPGEGSTFYVRLPTAV